MERFNRFLLVTFAACVFLTTVLTLVGIWAEVKAAILWKAVGSGVVLLFASGFMLAANFHILRIRAEIEGKRKARAEPDH